MTKPEPGTWVSIKDDLVIDRTKVENEPIVLHQGLTGIVLENEYSDHLVDVDFSQDSDFGPWVWTIEPCELEY